MKFSTSAASLLFASTALAHPVEKRQAMPDIDVDILQSVSFNCCLANLVATFEVADSPNTPNEAIPWQ